MIILTLRTDKPEAELGLFHGSSPLGHIRWIAHRELAASIHRKLEQLLSAGDKELADIQGIVGFSGPGSFTGLRIGLSVANALAFAYDLPIVAERGEGWQARGIDELLSGRNDRTALPFYNTPAATTTPKK